MASNIRWLLGLAIMATGHASAQSDSTTARAGTALPVCILGAAAPVPLAKPVLTSDSAVVRTCLVDAATTSKDARVIDLRPRDQYAAFHIPGADNQPMTALMNQGSKKAVVYDAGKLPQDAQLLCERLARYGLTQFQVIDGGLAAWSQLHAPARAAEVSRLSDAEVSSALLANEGQVLALSAEFNPVLKTIQSQARKPGKRLIVLASSPALLPQIQKQLSRKPGGRTALYWIGDADRLQSLISTHIAQDQKRLDGPGHSNTCSSL